MTCDQPPLNVCQYALQIIGEMTDTTLIDLGGAIFIAGGPHGLHCGDSRLLLRVAIDFDKRKAVVVCIEPPKEPDEYLIKFPAGTDTNLGVAK